MYDALGMGLSATVNAGVTQVSSFLELSGFRRYRLKVVQLTGTGPTRVRAIDEPFSRNLAQSWEIVVLAAAQATGVRSVYNLGEGTANLVNFMGPYMVIDLQNNGPDSATYEVEFWAQC